MSAELACKKYELHTCVPVMKMVCGGRSGRAGTVFNPYPAYVENMVSS